MNILFVLEYYPPHIGGVEIVFENICKGLASRGHNITVVTSKLKGTKNYEVIKGIKIYRIQTYNRYLFTWLSIPKVYKLAKEANVIHTTTYNGAFPAWFASKMRSRKIIITIHEILGSSWKNLSGMGYISAMLHQLLEKMVVSLPFNEYVCVSKSTCESLKNIGIKNRNLRVIYNGIDGDLFHPDNSNRKDIRKKLRLEKHFVYMYYGRPGISKGVEYLIQAVPLVSQVIPHSKLLIILAQDPLNRYEYIMKMIDDLNINNKIILLDPVPRVDLPSYIAASDCVVAPSLSEGFGFTAAEACAMNKPVIASNIASLPEVVSGIFVMVEPRQPQAIADAINKIYKGEIGRTKKKNFNWEYSIERYIEVYKEITSNN